MNARLIFVYLLFICLLITFYNSIQGSEMPMTDPEKVGISKSRLQRVDAVIEKGITNKSLPGAVLLVARKGKVVYKKAYGNRMVEPKVEKMTLDTIFDMASVTKPVATATGIMLLVEDGKLRLGDKVSKYIPGFEQKGKDRVNLMNLLTHTSGLPAWDRYFEKNLDHDGIINDICAKDTVYEPGKKFVYSDLGFIMLGEIIARVSGKPENEFVQERIFGPLGMVDTGYLPPKEKWNRCVATEPRNGKMLKGEVHDGNAWILGGVAGHAGLYSTADDLSIYCQMMLNGGIYKKTRILSPLTIIEMTKNQSPVKDESRGFGWDIGSSYAGQRGDIFPRGGFGHTGWTGTSLWLDPNSETFIVLLSNRNHPDGTGDVIQLRALVSNIVASSIIKQ